MNTTDANLRESLAYVREHTKAKPVIGIILGSGLGDFAESLKITASIPTQNIPNYPRSSVQGHKGRLVLANHGGKELLVLQGRVHFYESTSVESVLYPIRVAHLLGIKTLIVTNAAGGLNRSFSPGDLMLITDQINLVGERHTGMFDQLTQTKPQYNKALIADTLNIARVNEIPLRMGVYVGLKGPSYETSSEVDMVYRIGGDAVGMSTVLEVTLASQLGMDVLGISCITNLGTGISRSKLNHEEVTEVGNRVKKTFSQLVSSIIQEI